MSIECSFGLLRRLSGESDWSSVLCHDQGLGTSIYSTVEFQHEHYLSACLYPWHSQLPSALYPYQQNPQASQIIGMCIRPAPMQVA